MAKSKRGEKFQSAHSYNQHSINGWYMSEKLDGMRVRIEDGRLITMLENTLAVPDEWVEQIPNGIVLDGELYLPDGSRQELLAIVKDRLPDRAEWKRVKFCPFDIVNADPYIINYKTLSTLGNGVINPVRQERLPFKLHDARERLSTFVSEIIDRGGEGAMIRDPMARYKAGRQDHILKVKPRHDAEARIVGFRAGKHGKFHGMIGSICVKMMQGKVPIYLDIGGLTDDERQFLDEDGKRYAILNPGAVVPDRIAAKHFARGTYITFKYRGKTNDGVPMEAQYWRKYEDD